MLYLPRGSLSFFSFTLILFFGKKTFVYATENFEKFPVSFIDNFYI